MLSKRLKAARLKKKLTQQELANRLKTTKGTISNYENGHSTPSNEMLKELALVLEVSTDYLLGVTDSINTSLTHLPDDEEEMKEFFSNPELNLFFKEMKESPEEQLEELREIWEVIKKRNKKK
ncbi:helix-turn-helix transcriptional regulator [Pseudobacillus sp. FSL P4-0506]|uniref:helix-turn-helix domain-containing protein n=1 Tax=Pseudobacillus sp. FSL P4-0506 TaxID=2921576 RepID=UPI0030FB254C